MKRVISLDVLRGMTVAGMILVNNPAQWGAQYSPLKHAQWNGLTPTDLVFPFFLFIMGVSAYFSLSKRAAADKGSVLTHVMIRSVMIFATGLLLQLMSRVVWGTVSDWGSFRIMGVLQALSLSYLFGSLILVGIRFRHMLPISFALLSAYALLLLIGDGYALSPDNIIARIDSAILGESHLYTQSIPEGGRMAFDPEGIVSTLPKIAHFLLGAFVGKLIAEDRENMTMAMSKILLFGAAILIAGYLLQYGLPLNKKIWSPTFTLVSCGYASLTLGILVWLIDVKGKNGWTSFFRVFGSNPLFLYCIAWLFAILLGIQASDGMSVKALFYSACLKPYLGEPFGSLVYSLLMVGGVWLVGLPLYRKHIYIKL